MKFIWIISPEGVPALHTHETRWERLRDALVGFTEAPIMGHGLQNLRSYAIAGTTHNDYARILVELGLVGETLFLTILLLVAPKCLRRPRGPAEATWVALASSGATWGLLISPVFIDMYTSPHFWVFMALFLVATERQPTRGRVMANEGGRAKLVTVS